MKERIIGAVVLVIIVVLIVPVFLDGPPEHGEVTSERVLLPGQNEQDTKTVVLDRERSAPIPPATQDSEAEKPAPVEQAGSAAAAAADKDRSTAVEVEPVPQQAEEKLDSPARDQPPPAAASTTGMWAVQLGSFSNEENAEKLASDLRKQGYAAFVSRHSAGSRQYYRVRIGPQKDRESADAMAARLLKVGHEGQVLPHP